mmetsp:Transcript_12508/g.44253  ORF Transcript_12508/g.44253 Transcript_12508/m.44253 type:complete len:231 (+) Transcript_12508:1865-2557(+)
MTEVFGCALFAWNHATVQLRGCHGQGHLRALPWADDGHALAALRDRQVQRQAQLHVGHGKLPCQYPQKLHEVGHLQRGPKLHDASGECSSVLRVGANSCRELQQSRHYDIQRLPFSLAHQIQGCHDVFIPQCGVDRLLAALLVLLRAGLGLGLEDRRGSATCWTATCLHILQMAFAGKVQCQTLRVVLFIDLDVTIRAEGPVSFNHRLRGFAHTCYVLPAKDMLLPLKGA